MPIMSLLNQAKGPLPLFVTFSAPSDGPACLVVSGSVWTGVANQTIGIDGSIQNQEADDHHKIVRTIHPQPGRVDRCHLCATCHDTLPRYLACCSRA